MTDYKQIAPPAQLVPYVRHFAVLENSGFSGDATSYKIITDGCPGMIFQEDPAAFHKNGKNLPQLFLYGIHTSHSEKTATGSYKNIGVYFKPHAIRSIFGINAWELTDQYADVKDVINTTLPEQLLYNSSTEVRVAIISDFLTGLLSKNKSRQTVQVDFALRCMSPSTAGTTFKNICANLNIPERSLERLFKVYVGISPNLYFRINRFQNALRLVRTGYRSLTEVAYACAYADQSHYIRDFKEFSGFSPKHYSEKTNEKAANFPELKK